MFLDVLRRRNPQSIEQAIALHQAGKLPANAYVIDRHRRGQRPSDCERAARHEGGFPASETIVGS